MTNQVLLSSLSSVEKEVKGLLVGNRIPRDYFVTKGSGESDITVHAGSYHLALKKAGIEMCNIMTYSSILPGIARKVEKPAYLEHGAVMESIMSVCNATKGEEACAGIIYGWLYNRKTHEKFGGLVCEHNGTYGMEQLLKNLDDSLEELYRNGFSEKYYLKNIERITEHFVPRKKYGTALVGICFLNYVYPIFS